MKFEDLNPLLMMQPVLNKIIMLANEAMVCKPKVKMCRLKLATTPLYHTVLDKMFEESRKARFKKSKGLHYPVLKYLGNIEVLWIPKKKLWKVTITNGGSNRKNTRLKRKVCHVIYVRKIKGIYVEEEDSE